MNKCIFREYDIRGVVDTELMLDQAYNLGRAIISYLQRKNPQARQLVIGRDGRSHSLKLQTALIQACLEHGIDVFDIGLVPTPTLYYTVCNMNVPFGLEVTASHNPKEYNGVKIWGVWGQEIQKIRSMYEVQDFEPLSETAGTLTQMDGITPYISFLTEEFKALKELPINAIIDCGNGSAGAVYPQLVKAMKWKNVKLLYPEVDGNFPHHEADPTVLRNMQDVAQELAANESLQLGIGLDGDCDRMTPMTKTGKLVYGDILLGIFAQDILKNNPKAPIVCDIKSSGALFEVLEQQQATYHISPSGHSIIKEQMIKHKALLAGELSCHFFFKDRYFGFDDGIYASLRLLELLTQQEKRIEELVATFPEKQSSPEIRIGCPNDQVKLAIMKQATTFFAAQQCIDMVTIDGVRMTQPYGWGLIRASNTQPALCLRFESSDITGLNQIKADFFKALKPHFDEAFLHEQFAQKS